MTNIFRMMICSLSLALWLALSITTAVNAEEYWLRAAVTSVDLPGEAGVPMWGYALDADDNFATVDGTVTIPGPALVVTDGTLTIHLRNDLPEPTSLVIPGQNSLKPTPVFFAGGPFNGRVRSFTAEAAAAGGEVTYVYPSIAPGTYLYQSGSHPGVQVPMGLYGALSSDVAAGEAYAGQNYDQALTYLFSEVDVAQHRAVAAGNYGTPAYPSTMTAGYKADYFLLNGRSYTAEEVPVSLVPGDQILLRLLNAGLRSRVPVIPGVALEILAEDGNAYPTPRKQASVDLAAGKTLDARFTAPGAGNEQYLSLFDRGLGVSDSSRSSQGMLAHMLVGTPGVSLHVAAPANSANRVEVSSLPGGISCGTSCDQTYLAGTGITLTSRATSSERLTGWQVYDGDPGAGGLLLTGLCTSLGDCTFALDGDRWVVPVYSSFTGLTILSPASGEILAAGTRYEIHWAAPAAAATFNVGYRLGVGSPWVSIAAGTSKSEAYWQIPTGLNLRGSSQLAVTSFDAGGNFLETVQTVLGLQIRDSVTLQQPNGGQTLTIGNSGDDPYTINWSNLVTASAVARVGLWYQLSAGTPWQYIAAVDGNLSSFSWALPALTAAANDVRIGVVLYNAKGEILVMDTSDTVFSILPAVAAPAASSSHGSSATGASTLRVTGAAIAAPPALQLQGPGEGAVLSFASGYTVLWETSLAADSFSLSYSLDLGQNWTPLAVDLTGDQYAWQFEPELQGSAQVVLRLEAFDAKGESLALETLKEPFAIE